MPSARPRVLYVSDLTYPAKGRRYGDEDDFLTSRLRDEFDVAVCHPLDTASLMDGFDVVVVRNSGPVLNYQAGKGYLLELTAAGYPVIPTVDRAQDLGRLPEADAYVVKPKLGADSIGLEFVSRERLSEMAYGDVLVQPRIDFRYEVSFYFVDRTLQYALYAPQPDRRWALEPYEPTDADREFAQRFVDWNDIAYGIQRVDACRAPGGELLLVELEDLNPYLSLDVLSPDARDAFVASMKSSLRKLIDRERP
jgi:hypothetical protein